MASAAATTAAPAFRLGLKWRRATLVVHILSAGAWFGLDVAMGVIVFTALGGDAETKALGYRALQQFVYWPIAVSGLVCLVSGLLLGLGTQYGLIRYWWVAIKLVLNIVLSTLVLILLRPGVEELAAQGQRVAAGELVPFEESDIMFPPIVSGTLLLVAFVLSVFKPWGRIRPRR